MCWSPIHYYMCVLSEITARNFTTAWLLCGYALEFLLDILKLLLHVVTHYVNINGLDIGKSPSLRRGFLVVLRVRTNLFPGRSQRVLG